MWKLGGCYLFLKAKTYVCFVLFYFILFGWLLFRCFLGSGVFVHVGIDRCAALSEKTGPVIRIKAIHQLPARTQSRFLFLLSSAVSGILMMWLDH